jgi:hypothetical protein
MPWVRGDRLKATIMAEILRAFVYRWTRENHPTAQLKGVCPSCNVRGGAPDDYFYNGHVAPIACRQYHPTVPLVSDAHWLATHAFCVAKRGELDARNNHCMPAYCVED